MSESPLERFLARFPDARTTPNGWKVHCPAHDDGTASLFVAEGRWVWNLAGVRCVLFRLPELVAAEPALPVYIAEGEKDVLRLVDLGLVATTNPLGAGKWQQEYAEHLLGRHVVILQDNDDAGRMHVREVAASLEDIAATARVLALPGLPPKGEVSDWIASGGTKEELERLAAEPEAPEKPDTRPVIFMLGGELHNMVTQAEDALLASSGPQIYQRGALVRISRMPSLTVRDGITRPPGALLINPLDVAYLVERLTQDANWRLWDGRAKRHKNQDCPEKVARCYLARSGEWRVPELIGIIEAPTLRPNGTLLTTPGYDDSSGLLLDIRGYLFPYIPENPTAAQVAAAVAIYRDLLCDFPFIADFNLAASVAAICTALVRRSLPSAPMFGFRAPKMRSGKTMLADCVALIATGRPCAVMAQAKDQDEEKKRLLSALLYGDCVLCYDNVDREFGGASISQALTQKTISDRLLGQSRSVTVPTAATFLATGNNLTFSGDITARVVPCDLDPEMEHPEERVFRRDLYDYIPKHRGELVAAALTILRGYQAAGMPEQGVPAWAGFDAWSRMVREAVVWAGFADPAGARDRLEDTDPVRVQLSALLSSWHSYIGDEQVTVMEVINRSKSDGTFSAEDPVKASLRAALIEVAGDRAEVINARRLGKYLLAHRDRIEGGLKVQKIGTRQGISRWRIARPGQRAIFPDVPPISIAPD